MSLKILLTLSLINKWTVITTELGSALLQAPRANEELVLVKPPPELEQNPDVLWKLTRALYGLKTSPKLWQQSLASKLEELGLRKNKVDPCIWVGDQLLVMIHLDALLIVGDKLQQESFINQLSAYISLKDTTQLDAKTPLTFLGKTLEHNKKEHSISLHLPTFYYMKLLKMYGMEEAKATSTLEDQLGQSEGLRKYRNKTLASARHKPYRTAVGQLLWATLVRPDISFAVKELSRSLKAPTQQDEQQLRQVLGYIKGILHFTTSLQPPRKRVIERPSSIQIQACFDSAWARSPQTKKSTSGSSLSLWGVPLATSSRTQATPTLSSAFMQWGWPFKMPSP